MKKKNIGAGHRDDGVSWKGGRLLKKNKKENLQRKGQERGEPKGTGKREKGEGTIPKGVFVLGDGGWPLANLISQRIGG